MGIVSEVFYRRGYKQHENFESSFFNEMVKSRESYHSNNSQTILHEFLICDVCLKTCVIFGTPNNYSCNKL
jgi:hypothetical protein